MSGKTIIKLTPDQIKEAFEKATGERILEMCFMCDAPNEDSLKGVVNSVVLTIDRKRIKEENNKPVSHE